MSEKIKKRWYSKLYQSEDEKNELLMTTVGKPKPKQNQNQKNLQEYARLSCREMRDHWSIRADFSILNISTIILTHKEWNWDLSSSQT